MNLHIKVTAMTKISFYLKTAFACYCALL